ncbi:hypothetical protein O4H52_00910 [Sphingomonadaceae bacterium G21617-S1]|nr:hypothetical protein [Sphingomonadaceae bacterium G21617-S1]
MSEQAQAKALAAAQAASEAITALLEYARHGGAIGEGEAYDMLYPLADAARLALETRGVIDGEDGRLYAAIVQWIDWKPE